MPKTVLGGVVELPGNQRRALRCAVASISFPNVAANVLEVPAGAVGVMVLRDAPGFDILRDATLDYSDGNRHNDRSMVITAVHGAMRYSIRMT